MGIFDFWRKKPQKVYERTEVTRALESTLPLWNDLINKYPQNVQQLFERSSTQAGKLAVELKVGIDRLLKGLAGAEQKGQDVDPEERKNLRDRLLVFQARERALNNEIAKGKLKSRR